jgi:hypothetical protein
MEVIMKSIRRGVFETNSSSTHSMTICPKEDYEAWQKGKVLFNENDNTFLTKKEAIKELGLEQEFDEEDSIEESLMDEGYYTYDQYQDRENDLEPFVESYTTKGGETIVIFGAYGYDG